jgi:hypothetical protein
VEKERFVVLMILQMIAVRVMLQARLLLVLWKHLLAVPQAVFVIWVILRMMVVDFVVGMHMLLARQAVRVVWTILRMRVLVLVMVL